MEDAGVDQVVFIQQAGANRHEDIMESLELFAERVLQTSKRGMQHTWLRKMNDSAEATERAKERKPALTFPSAKSQPWIPIRFLSGN